MISSPDSNVSNNQLSNKELIFILYGMINKVQIINFLQTITNIMIKQNKFDPIKIKHQYNKYSPTYIKYLPALTRTITNPIYTQYRWDRPTHVPTYTLFNYNTVFNDVNIPFNPKDIKINRIFITFNYDEFSTAYEKITENDTVSLFDDKYDILSYLAPARGDMFPKQIKVILCNIIFNIVKLFYKWNLDIFIIFKLYILSLYVHIILLNPYEIVILYNVPVDFWIHYINNFYQEVKNKIGEFYKSLKNNIVHSRVQQQIDDILNYILQNYNLTFNKLKFNLYNIIYNDNNIYNYTILPLNNYYFNFINYHNPKSINLLFILRNTLYNLDRLCDLMGQLNTVYTTCIDIIKRINIEHIFDLNNPNLLFFKPQNKIPIKKLLNNHSFRIPGLNQFIPGYRFEMVNNLYNYNELFSQILININLYMEWISYEYEYKEDTNTNLKKVHINSIMSSYTNFNIYLIYKGMRQFFTDKHIEIPDMNITPNILAKILTSININGAAQAKRNLSLEINKLTNHIQIIFLWISLYIYNYNSLIPFNNIPVSFDIKSILSPLAPTKPTKTSRTPTEDPNKCILYNESLVNSFALTYPSNYLIGGNNILNKYNKQYHKKYPTTLLIGGNNTILNNINEFHLQVIEKYNGITQLTTQNKEKLNDIYITIPMKVQIVKFNNHKKFTEILIKIYNTIIYYYCNNIPIFYQYSHKSISLYYDLIINLEKTNKDVFTFYRFIFIYVLQFLSYLKNIIYYTDDCLYNVKLNQQIGSENYIMEIKTPDDSDLNYYDYYNKYITVQIQQNNITLGWYLLYRIGFILEYNILQNNGNMDSNSFENYFKYSNISNYIILNKIQTVISLTKNINILWSIMCILYNINYTYLVSNAILLTISFYVNDSSETTAIKIDNIDIKGFYSIFCIIFDFFKKLGDRIYYISSVTILLNENCIIINTNNKNNTNLIHIKLQSPIKYNYRNLLIKCNHSNNARSFTLKYIKKHVFFMEDEINTLTEKNSYSSLPDDLDGPDTHTETVTELIKEFNTYFEYFYNTIS